MSLTCIVKNLLDLLDSVRCPYQISWFSSTSFILIHLLSIDAIDILTYARLIRSLFSRGKQLQYIEGACYLLKDNHAILEGSADASSLSSQLTKCCAKASLTTYYIACYALDPLHHSYKKSIVYFEVCWKCGWWATARTLNVYFLCTRSQNCERWRLRRVSPSVRMEKFGSHWTNFHEIWYWNIFRKSVEKIQVSVKSVKNNEYFIWIPMYIMVISLWILLKWQIVETNIVETIKTYILCSVTFFVVENRAVYETLRKEPDRPQMAIRRMRIACWITKATNAHSECAILIACPQQQLLHERNSMSSYMYCACLVYFHASQIVSIDSESTTWRPLDIT
jgi:hypothetical protein